MPRADDNEFEFSAEEATSGWSRLDTEEILRELIASETRDGRMTRSRERHILTYAKQLGVSEETVRTLIGEHGAGHAHRPGFARSIFIIAVIMIVELTLVFLFS